jgi:uncharacterized repeat protein (TIGR03943 family)
VNRRAQGVVLLLLGGGILRASVTGLYLRYVKAGLRPLLLVAGVVLILAALATFWHDRRTRKEHGHGHREPFVTWLLLLPLFALILVAPPALGSYAADRIGTALQPPGAFPDLPAGNPLEITLHDYAARAVYDHGHSLGTRQFKITGFVASEHHGTWYLTRMVFNCCAADAQPIKVGLAGQIPAGLASGTWLTVVGTYTARQVKDDINGGPIPFIEVDGATRIPPPQYPYEI